jgi:drug/metabolite transporter (DMT)-like permease
MRAPGRLGGLHDMALSAFFFSLMSLLVKLAGQRLEAPQVVLFRAAVALVLAWGMVHRAGLSPWKGPRGLLFLRGLLGFFALSCFFWALVHLPLAEATVIQYLNPVFTALLAALVLGERLRAREGVSVVGSLVGLLLVARPALLIGASAEPLDAVASLVALAGALFSAGSYVTVRRLGAGEHPLVIVFWFPLVATPLSLPWAVAVWQWPTPLEWLALVGVGVTTQIAQVYVTRGLAAEPAGRATAVSYLQIVFAAVWGVLVLGEVPDTLTWVGAALIVASTLLLLDWRRGR